MTDKMVRALVEAVEAILCRSKQRLYGLKEFTMRHFAAKVAPEHLDGIEPGAIGW